MNIMQLAADLAQRVPEMAKDSTANNAEFIARAIENEIMRCGESNHSEIPRWPSDLRDWFAGLAMDGIAVHQRNVDWIILAKRAYLAADAMLEERKKYDPRTS